MRSASEGRHPLCVLTCVPFAIGSASPFPQRVDVEVGKSASRPNALQPASTPTTAPAFAQRLSAETARQVEARRTPLSAATAESAIAQAYTDLTGGTLSQSARSILTAQWAHETGHGASMFNFNFGGIKGVGPSGLTVAQRTREGFGSSERRIVDNFRAYGSVEEGAKDYVQLLLSRYGSAVSAAELGDASGFVRGLKDRGYFTGDPAAYERSIATIANRILGSSGELPLASTQATRVVSTFETAPQANPRPSESDWGGRAVASSLPEWQRALSPSALLEVAGVYGQSASTTESTSDLSAVRALQMSDEITRAALRIALSDGEDSHRIGASTDAKR